LWVSAWSEKEEEDAVEEVADEPLYRDRVCGIDIGKAQMAATIRVPPDKNRSRRMQETRAFGTTKREVQALADWLPSWQVHALVMEATGDYWKPVFYRLEAAGLECVLADARQVKNLPGRPKRDASDSRWLAQNFERGAVRSCFVATPEFRVIRLHARYRRDLIEERTREKQRVEKLLESSGIKLSGVLSDLHGVSGRDIMDHLIAGERDPRVLAQLARRRARAKIPRLEQALDGTEFFTPGHSALLEAMLRRIDAQNTDIDRVSAVIEELPAPWEEQLQQAESMPGWQRRAAQDVLAETGPDMTRFATAAHLVSRAGRAPLDHQSGQRKGRGRRKKGNRYIGASAGETSVSAGRTKTREGATLPAAGPPDRQRQSPGRRKQYAGEGLPQARVQPRHALPGPRRRLLRQACPGQPQGQVPPHQARRPRLRRHSYPQSRHRRRGNRTGPSRLTYRAGH
jgi:transposase